MSVKFFNIRSWKAASALEVFKFSLYLCAPVFASVIYANPELMHKLILQFNFVNYPAAGPSPPNTDEFEKLIADRKAKRGKDV